MDHQRRCLRIGGAVIAGAVILRLLSAGTLNPLWQALTRPETVAVLMYLETGRVVRNYSSITYPAESPTPEFTKPAPAQPSPAVFSAEEADRIEVDYECGYAPDLGTLLPMPLSWDLTGGKPTVLIVHTHATESYTPSPGEEYAETADYRTLDENYNMIAIGDALAARLEASGIGVIHDRQLHDYPSYNGSYANSRESVESILEENPEICMVLDLHRDAAAEGSAQMDTSAQVNGKESAQLMIEVGTDAGGLHHPHWQENLALALKLQTQLETAHPGLCRPIDLCNERFNGDLSPGALLVEVGAAGNTLSEALTAAGALADGIIALARGANLTADPTS